MTNAIGLTEVQSIALLALLFVTFILNLFAIDNKFFHRAIGSMVVVSVLFIAFANGLMG